MNKTKTKKPENQDASQAKSVISLNSSMNLSGRQLTSQNLLDGINEFSDALSARDDSFHCGRRTIWGDRVSVQLIRRTGL